MQRILNVLADPGEFSDWRILADKDKVKAKLKSSLALVYSGRATDIVVADDTELTGLTHYLLKLALGVDCVLADALKPATETVEPAAFKKLFRATTGFATHAAKTLYPSAPSHRFIAPAPQGLTGITSADAHDGRCLYFAGNAADSMQKYFWTTDFTYEGDRHCLAELIAREHPVVLAALEEWSLAPGTVQAMVECAQSTVAPTLPDAAYRKQVLVPVYDETDEPDYVAITPIPSIALSDALDRAHKRFRERHGVVNEAGKITNALYVPGASSSLQFGGTKPQNINDFASSVGGNFPVLEARIPKIRMRHNLKERAARGYALIDLSHRDNPEAALIDRKLVHRNQMASFRICAEAFVQTSLSSILEYADLMQEAYDQGVMAAKAEGRVIKPGEFDLPLTTRTTGLAGVTRLLLTQEQLTKEQVASATKIMIKGIQEYTFVSNIMTDMAMTTLHDIIDRTFRQWRNPVRKHHG